MQALFGPERHEPLAGDAWSEAAARAAIEQWATAANQAFDPDRGWLRHPRDGADLPDAPMHDLYCGSGGAIWALEHLADRGAVDRQHDFRPFVADIVQRNQAHMDGPTHGTQSFLLGDSGLLLLQWKLDRSDTTAQRLHDTVQSNLHNPTREALWGSPGSVLAAIAMAEHTGAPHWAALVRQAVQIIWNEMEPIAAAGGAWGWVQHVHGRVETLIGAGHGFIGNVFPALRGAAFIEPAVLDAYAERALAFLQATALRDGDFVNWWPSVPRYPTSTKPPFLQDCHGAPGLLSRLAAWPRSVPHTDIWDELLRQAGGLTWQAGPINKGVAFCHGSAGSAHAFLKLFVRSGEQAWLDRARAFAMHGIKQAERDCALHGQGRHTLWSGDLGMACVMWDCITGQPAFPTLDVF